MIKSIYVRVDLSDDYISKDIILHEGDINGTELLLSVYDNNSEFDLAGCTAEYDATIAGRLAEESTEATISNINKIKVPVTANMTALSGLLLIDVKIKKGDDILTVYTVSADVKRAVINGGTKIDISGATIKNKLEELAQTKLNTKVIRLANLDTATDPTVIYQVYRYAVGPPIGWAVICGDTEYEQTPKAQIRFDSDGKIYTRTGELIDGVITWDKWEQLNDLSQYAKKAEMPTKVSDLTNDSGFISSEQEIGYLSSKERTEYLSLKSDIVWVQGSVSKDNGNNMSSTTRCRTGYVIFDDTVAIQISVKVGYKVAIAAYDDSYVGLIRSFSNGQAVYKITNKRYKFVVAYDDDAEITPEDIPVDCITVVNYARSKDIAEKEVEMATCFEQLIADKQRESLTWKQGNLSTYDSAYQSEVTSRCCTEGYIFAKRGTKISVMVSEGYMCRIMFYTSPRVSGFLPDKKYIGWLTENYHQIITEDCYIRLVIGKQDNSDITPTDITFDALTLSQSVYQDDTLTAENLPAQAKAVGDAIDKISDCTIYDSLTENYEWVQGGISNTSGANISGSTRCRSKYFFFGDATLKVRPKDGYKFNVFRFDRTPINDSMYSGYFRDSLGALDTKEAILRTEYCYIRFVIAKTDDSDITPGTVPSDCLDIGIVKSPTNLPAEYSAHLFDKIQAVNDNAGIVGKNGETFIFITDLHWDSGNMKKSPMMVRRILENTPVNTIICGGDLINNGTDKEAEKRRINDCIKQFYDPRTAFPVAFGNHDDNSNTQEEYTERHFSRNEVFALMMKQASNEVTYLNDVDWSFTYDRPGTKTRFLFIDTGRTGKKGEQDGDISLSARQSVYNALNNVPAGYQVIVVAHWLYSITDSDFTPYGSELVSVLEAYNSRSSIKLDGKTYDYIKANGECKCIMIGHSHDDAQGVTANGIPWILTDSDNLQRSHNFKDKQYRHQNTITEQCFDVVSIDYDTGDIHIIRFGAGADRDYSASIGTWSSSNDNILAES